MNNTLLIHDHHEIHEDENNFKYPELYSFLASSLCVLGSTLSVAGKTNLSNGLNVLGVTNLSSKLNVDGHTNLRSGLAVEGNTNITGRLKVGTITFPTSDGSNGQLIKTDGSGNLSFVDQSSSLSLID